MKKKKDNSGINDYDTLLEVKKELKSQIHKQENQIISGYKLLNNVLEIIKESKSLSGKQNNNTILYKTLSHIFSVVFVEITLSLTPKKKINENKVLIVNSVAYGLAMFFAGKISYNINKLLKNNNKTEENINNK